MVRLWSKERFTAGLAMPCWWVQTRMNELSKAAASRVFILCACARFWPNRTLVPSVLTFLLVSGRESGNRSFRQACAVRKEDSRYETGQTAQMNWACEPLHSQFYQHAKKCKTPSNCVGGLDRSDIKSLQFHHTRNLEWNLQFTQILVPFRGYIIQIFRQASRSFHMRVPSGSSTALKDAMIHVITILK